MRLLFCNAILTLWAAAANYGADFTTYIGDQNQYQVAALTADSAGNTYVTGRRIHQVPAPEYPWDVFVTKLDPSGNLVFTQTFPGVGETIAVDSSGDIWVGGSPGVNFPLLNPLPGAQSSPDGFLMKLAPDGTMLYSSYFYGEVYGIATDSSGNVYLTGATSYSAFPTTAGCLIQRSANTLAERLLPSWTPPDRESFIRHSSRAVVPTVPVIVPILRMSHSV